MKNEEFEKLAGEQGYATERIHAGVYINSDTRHAFKGYQMRQPEIDALIFKNAELEGKILKHQLWESEEIDTLKDANKRLAFHNRSLQEEVEKLRDAADRAEGFLFAVSLMPQLGPKVQEVALRHHEALRAAMKETK